MKNKKNNKLINGLLGLATLSILLGAFLKLLHYPYSNLILFLGFTTSFVTSWIQISRLKKKIKELEKETPERGEK